MKGSVYEGWAISQDDVYAMLSSEKDGLHDGPLTNNYGLLLSLKIWTAFGGLPPRFHQ